jgi:multidrug efflux pump subunit AcrB
MDQVGGALIAIALTLCAVFVRSAFISGISGLFFRQFAVTIELAQGVRSPYRAAHWPVPT